MQKISENAEVKYSTKGLWIIVIYEAIMFVVNLMGLFSQNKLQITQLLLAIISAIVIYGYLAGIEIIRKLSVIRYSFIFLKSFLIILGPIIGPIIDSRVHVNIQEKDLPLVIYTLFSLVFSGWCVWYLNLERIRKHFT